MKANSVPRTIGLLLVIAALAYVYYGRGSSPADPADPAPRDRVEESRRAIGDDQAIVDAFVEKRSGIMVESEGIVEKVLPDDLEGSRHQRFILRLQSGQTVLISHNIDIAPRISLAERDSVEFRGQYEWNKRGGVVHWTHHDPDGSHSAGWLRHRRRLYE